VRGSIQREHRALRAQTSLLLQDSQASAIVEFTVALPLLVVLVVGIFDFGAAFNLKQQLNNAVREGARFGASQPTNDLNAALAPPSVDAVRYLVDSYLKGSNINDCGLSGAPRPAAGGALTWTYQTTALGGNGCVGNLSLTISRGNALSETVGGAAVNLFSTQVRIEYPYQWHFSSVIQLLVPGANLNLPLQIESDATAVNMD
jgi:Flp pilus assembly protein TadG